ncbi:Endonuclease V [Sphingomonas laterariae]|uniref:Endonuclease V n=1 Tax=Edaphosphingomonas laterariae TaxID=861865 RepID=A0A239E1R5_9SPHN|nr:endonuclease V [Sphingomonas laterariae]SNS37922.1 Endonuclease V [Sphingomonas laterariae]
MSREWLEVTSLKEATAVQRLIAARVETANRIGPSPRVAGADVSMKWRDTRGPVHAAIAPVDGAAGTLTAIPAFPYVPGYLGFREAPVLAAAWDAMADKPGLILVDGQGRAHPRRAGVACQLGVMLDVPTIGCAKSLLCGVVEGAIGPAAGDRAPVIDRGELVAMALRTRPRAAPIYVSIGHRIALDTAIDWVMRLSEGRRLPLPIRLAHDAANATRRAYEATATHQIS